MDATYVPRVFRRVLLLGCLASAGALAQIPVTVTSDAPAVMHQVETMARWAQQLKSMSDQLAQMRQVHATLQGSRGLGGLLQQDLVNQFLPEDYLSAIQGLKIGSGPLSPASGVLADIVRANQLKSCTELNSDVALRLACTQQWQQLALQRQIGDLGYRKASENIRNLQVFVSSINASSDQKAISEVQARVQVETVRMLNEQVKLAAIQSMEEANRRLRQQAAVDSFNAGMARGAAGGIRMTP